MNRYLAVSAKAQTSPNLRKPPVLRTARLFVLGPILVLALLGVTYLLLRPQLPSHLVRHLGPDGIGLSPTWLVLLIGGAIAVVLFVVALCCASDFWRHDHWYQTQKTIVVSFVAAGYAVTGLLLASLLSVRGMEPSAVTGDSIGIGLLTFLLVLILAIWGYIVLLPAGKFEEPWDK